jgi:nucleotide-binding universal stress UspA family protein
MGGEYMKVLIAIDDSDCSMAAFNNSLGRNWDDELHLRIITVVEPVYVQYAMAAGYVQPMIEAQKAYSDYCEVMIKERIAQASKALPKAIVTGEVLFGNIPACIVDDATSWEADLLVLGSHGRKGFERFLLGSVAERVCAQAPCSVEVIKVKHAPAKKNIQEERKAAHV